MADGRVTPGMRVDRCACPTATSRAGRALEIAYQLMDPAFRTFFDEWYPRLVHYLRARLGDEDLAEDIAQEAFVRLLDCAPRDPVGWVFVVASNLAVDQLRVARGRARHLALIRAGGEGTADPGPEQSYLRAEAISRVRSALTELPERDRELLLLRHGGWRYRDIARMLGVAPSSIGSLLTRAQRRFAATFAELNDAGDRRASL